MADVSNGCRLVVSTAARLPNETMTPVLMTMDDGPPVQATRARFLGPMIARVRTLEAGALAAATANGATAADLSARLDALKVALAAAGVTADAQARSLGALADRTSAQEQAVTALATRIGTQESASTALAARVNVAETATTALTARVAATETAAAALGTRLDAQAKALADATARIAALETAPRQVAAFTGSAKVPALALAAAGTITLTGLTPAKTGDVLKAGERVVVEPQSALPAGLVVTSARVTADGTVTLQTAALVAVAAGTTALVFNVTALRA